MRLITVLKWLDDLLLLVGCKWAMLITKKVKKVTSSTSRACSGGYSAIQLGLKGVVSVAFDLVGTRIEVKNILGVYSLYSSTRQENTAVDGPTPLLELA